MLGRSRSRSSFLAAGLLVVAAAAGGVLFAVGCGSDDSASPPSPDAGAPDATRGDVDSGAAGSDGGSGAGDAAVTGPSDGGGSSTDAASDAGGDGGFTPGAPITATADTWTWVDVPASKCGAGTPTGIGVNPHTDATALMIYMEGGGSCTTGDTCWGPTPGATNMGGYDATTFQNTSQRAYPVFDRMLGDNPFAAMNMVFIPYCTGDLHGGANIANLTLDDGGTQPTYFYGAFDMDRFLERLVPTFPNMTRVYLVGTSAGGFGTFINFDRVARDFGVTVYILDDSGPPIPDAKVDGAAPPGSDFGVWRFPLPPSCPTCSSLRDLYDDARSQQPNSRFGLLTYDEDSTIAPDFGYTPAEYPQVIATFATSISADANAHIYEVDTTTPSHVVESAPSLAEGYLPWMTALVTDDPSWTSTTVNE